MKLDKLPGWVVDERTSVLQEVAPYIDASPSERLAATRACCRAAMNLLRYHSDPARALAWVDPLPEKSKTALARLRAR